MQMAEGFIDFRIKQLSFLTYELGIIKTKKKIYTGWGLDVGNNNCPTNHKSKEKKKALSWN